MKRSENIILAFIFVLALFLRCLFVFNNSISFHYDMARDAFTAREIWKDHDLKILGPPSSLEGLYHGVLWYYLIAPFYLLGNGNPQFPSFFLSLINCLSLVPIYALSLKIFKERKWGILSCLLFSVSFGAVQLGPWLSNPGPSLIFTGFFFWGLKLWQENNKWGLWIAVFSAAIATQFQLFLLYLFILLPIFGYLFKIKVTRNQVFISFFLGLCGLSSILISALKFGMLQKTVGIMFSISKSQPAIESNLFTKLAGNYLNHLANLFTNNFFPVNLFIGGLLCFLTFYACRKEKFLLFALFSSLLIFFFGGHGSNYADIGILIPAILSVNYLVQIIIKKSRNIGIAFITVMVLANLFSIAKNITVGQVSLVIPKDMVLSRQLDLIDKTYEIASGKPFTINTLTLPLWTNTTWSYLYSWYGKNSYGYAPEFYGRDQTGMPGEGVLSPVSTISKISFFIMESKNGIPDYLYSKEIEAENARTSLISEYRYGDITVQQRSKR